MKHTIEHRNEVSVVKLDGSLDVSVQKEFSDVLSRQASSKDNDIALDFSAVSFIDSACLGILASQLKLARKAGGDIKIAALNDEVLSIFQITRLNGVFDLHDTVDDAIASFYK